MKANGYRGELAYDDHGSDTRAGKRTRKSNVVWFNPHFSERVKQNIGKEFLKLASKHFSLNFTIYIYASIYASVQPQYPESQQQLHVQCGCNITQFQQKTSP